MTIAYLDAGSGSLIVSAVVGGAAAAGIAVRQARHKLTTRFSRRRPDAEVDAEGATDQVDAEGATDQVDAEGATDQVDAEGGGAGDVEVLHDS